jgi:hypothetical protein
MPDYHKKKIKGSLVIAPVHNPTVSYFGNVKEEFGEGDKEELIINHFNTELVKRMKTKSTFHTIVYGTYKKTPVLKKTKFQTDDVYDVHLYMPEDTSTIEFEEIVPDYILFLEDLYIGTERALNEYKINEQISPVAVSFNSMTYLLQSQFPSVGAPPPINTFNNYYFSQPKNTYLLYKCGFAYWDNKNHNVVAYGKIQARSRADSYGMGMVSIVRKQNWMEIDDWFVRNLLNNTPFDAQNYYR